MDLVTSEQFEKFRLYAIEEEDKYTKANLNG